jgi:pilus assembly protein CpaB
MRAVSTEVSPETGAGGFILPNDRVDVILSKREKNPDRNSPDVVNSQVILGNIRVLAIDQTIEEKNGQKVVVGKTATLELKPRQSEALARARQSGTLSLALRSLTDANEPLTTPREEGSSENIVNVFRGEERETYNCKPLCRRVTIGADGT